MFSTRIDSQFLNGVTLDFIDAKGPDLSGRFARHNNWWEGRLSNGVDPYSKFSTGRIEPRCRVGLRDGSVFEGVNFASQDYLGLASHPRVVDAVQRAAEEYGVHSAGSAALMGNTALSRRLEDRLAGFLGYADCTVFPTGWGAGYGAIRKLVRPSDHVVIDVLAHACLQEGARNATKNVHTFPHLSNDAVRRRLARLRQEAPDAGILVVTETVFSMDSDVPDFAELKEICAAFDATLFVDCAHDLGAIGPTGRGYLELQNALEAPDILMGSFSKTFASNGGFVACNNPALKLALRYGCGPLTFTNALAPIQCAAVLECLDIVQSPEGARLRESLMRNAAEMRSAFEASDFEVLGKPSAIIPVVLGPNALSRLMTKYAFEHGGVVNLVEYPAVSRGSSRWRAQVMASHTSEQIQEFVSIARKARAAMMRGVEETV